MERTPGNIRILLVDDDPLVLKIYKDGLSRLGLQVETASDGLAAVQSLRAARPDLVVLDMMMPKFSGLDTIKIIRSQTPLAGLPIIMLSNSYMNDMASEAVAAGVQKALLKVRCTPTLLASIIQDVVAGRESPENVAVTLAMPKPESAKPIAPPPASAAATAPAGPAPAPVPTAANAAEFMAKSREDFLAKPSEMLAALRGLEQAVSRSATAAERSQRLEVFYRKVHFLSATAGLAECHLIARMACAFEALLFELMEKPAFFGPSVLLTIARTIDFFGVLFQRALESDSIIPLATAEGLVVDDDPLSNRVVVAALRRAEVKAQSIEDPLAALQLLAKRPCDLILLDIEMPGLDGFELCRRVRLLPGHQKTPVIYVTAHADFDSRARSVLTGGNELISKPVFPIELAVKAVTHMLKAQLAQ